MIYREIVHTCSNSEVARAAVDSIGGEFAQRFAADATRRDLSSGAWAARLVREFADRADEVEWHRVSAAAYGADQPILGGLRYILERSARNATPPAWMICAAYAQA
jgi:hypothetical protein